MDVLIIECSVREGEAPAEDFADYAEYCVAMRRRGLLRGVVGPPAVVEKAIAALLKDSEPIPPEPLVERVGPPPTTTPTPTKVFAEYLEALKGAKGDAQW